MKGPDLRKLALAKLLWTRTTVSQAFRPYEEFLQMQAEIEDYGDLRDVTASAMPNPPVPSTTRSRTSKTDLAMTARMMLPSPCQYKVGTREN